MTPLPYMSLCMMVQRGSAWPDFKGTWDLPARIPAHPINPTSRSVEGLDRLKCWGFDLQHTGTSRPHSKNKYIPKNVDTQVGTEDSCVGTPRFFEVFYSFLVQLTVAAFKLNLSSDQQV